MHAVYGREVYADAEEPVLDTGLLRDRRDRRAQSRSSLHHYGVAPIGLIAVGVVAVVVAAIVAAAIRVASAWDRAVVLRLGKFRALKGPGLFGIIPIIDTIPYWIDIRVITSSFKAEKTLTKDTVPVDVDAVLFWKVVDPEKAALAVADYTSAISWAAQTALRDVIGKTMLADLLEGRDKISERAATDHRRAHGAVGCQRDLRRGQGRA